MHCKRAEGAGNDAWDVSEHCVEFVSDEPQIRAVGRYAVDAGVRGHLGDAAAAAADDDDATAASIGPNLERCVKRGSFGTVVNIVDYGVAAFDDVQRGEYVLRVCADKAAFGKQCEFLFATGSLVTTRQSPFFLRMRTAFSCSSHIDHTTGFGSAPIGGDSPVPASAVAWTRVFDIVRANFGIAKDGVQPRQRRRGALRQAARHAAAAPALLLASKHAEDFARCLDVRGEMDDVERWRRRPQRPREQAAAAQEQQGGAESGKVDWWTGAAADDEDDDDDDEQEDGGYAAGGVPLYCLVMERANSSTLAELIATWAQSATAAATRTATAAHSSAGAAATAVCARYPDTSSVLMFQLAQAVAAMHRAGIVHRDLKASNVVLDCRGTPAAVPDAHFEEFELASRANRETGGGGGGGGSSGSGGATVPTFGFFDAALGMRLYRPPALRRVPGADCGGAVGAVRVKIIDFDFSMFARGGQIKHYTWTTKGSPTNMAPELVYLTCAGFNATRHVFKPDVFSLGVLCGELATERPMTTLLAEHGFRRELMRPHNTVYVVGAYVGFASYAALRTYRAFIERYLEGAPKKRSTRSQRNTAMQALLALRDLFDERALIDAVCAMHGAGAAVADCVRHRWGVTASTMHRGALFCRLAHSDAAAAAAVATPSTRNAALTSMLRGMLEWDFERRSDIYDVLFSPMFDCYQSTQPPTPPPATPATPAATTTATCGSDMWLLSVPHLGAPAAEAPRQNGERGRGRRRDCGAASLAEKARLGECALPGCSATSKKYASRQYTPTGSAAEATAPTSVYYCSGRCERVGEAHDWWHQAAAGAGATGGGGTSVRACKCGALPGVY